MSFIDFNLFNQNIQLKLKKVLILFKPYMCHMNNDMLWVNILHIM